MLASSIEWSDPLFRAINPVYAQDPLSGEGARRYGGRFNAKGTPALYLATSPEGALREANQVGHLQPTTLVEYRGVLAPILDAISIWPQLPTAVQHGDDWRLRMTTGDSVPTQDWAASTHALGYHGALVPSFAPSAPPGARNLVLWDWEALQAIDDENRLALARNVETGLR